MRRDSSTDAAEAPDCIAASACRGECAAPYITPECVAQARAIRPQLPELRTVMTTEGGAPEWQDYAAWRDAQSADDPKAEIRRQDIAIQLYTSGTTGRPKGAMLSRQPYQPHGDRRGRKAGMETGGPRKTSR